MCACSVILLCPHVVFVRQGKKLRVVAVVEKRERECWRDMDNSIFAAIMLRINKINKQAIKDTTISCDELLSRGTDRSSRDNCVCVK